MVDLRSQIARSAYINAQILDIAEQLPIFRECVKTVLRKQGCEPKTIAHYTLKGAAAYWVSLLYCLIVVPKEVFGLDENDCVYQAPELRQGLGLFEITKKTPKFDTHPTFYLIYHLRNSLSHANFSIWQETDAFEFRDRPRLGAQDNFCATITSQNLGRFLSDVGRLLANREGAASDS